MRNRNYRTAKSTKGNEIRIWQMTEGEYRDMCDEYQGICLGCGETRDECEPDARAYRCDACDERRVYGAEEALSMGRIELTDSEESEAAE